MASNKNRFSSTPSTSLVPWLGIATIVILLDQITKITIAKMMRPYDAHKNVVAYFGRLTERPTVQRALKEAQEYMATTAPSGRR